MAIQPTAKPHAAHIARLAKQAVDAIAVSLEEDYYLGRAWNDCDSEVQQNLKQHWQEYIERLFTP